jgi:flagella basal body P-ring formation protein FlgA
MSRLARLSLEFVLATAMAASVEPRPAAQTTTVTAAEAIADAVRSRLGGAAQVTVLAIDGVELSRPVREAKPDPVARLGAPIRFTLIEERGPRIVIATVKVVADRVVTRRALLRGETLTADDVEIATGTLEGVPLRALLTGEQVIGSRALRPIDAAAVILPGFVAVKNAVDAGDKVTVVAVRGLVQVSAEFVAADSGRPGDVIRVMNPATRRYIRGRIVKPGLVEVMNEE